MSNHSVDTLILGANSYVGQHLALALKSTDAVLHTKSPPNPLIAQLGMRHYSEDLESACDLTRKLTPRQIMIVGRPADPTDEKAYARFDLNLRTLIEHWLSTECLKRIVFLSTQLVYETPKSAEPIGVDFPLGPQTAYERSRVAMEDFLLKRAGGRGGCVVEVYRLPLVGGGFLTEAQTRQQYFGIWRSAYLRGKKWPVDESTLDWGNSWVHVVDLSFRLVTQPKSRTGIHQPVSGHFTYKELHLLYEQMLQRRARRKNGPPGKSFPGQPSLALPRTFFFLRDTEGMPPLPPRAIYRLKASLSHGA